MGEVYIVAYLKAGGGLYISRALWRDGQPRTRLKCWAKRFHPEEAERLISHWHHLMATQKDPPKWPEVLHFDTITAKPRRRKEV
jgi:hypothetical protein